uniref:Calponin n=2 Tax=Gopherus TaxID=38771 RepID=A0A452I5G0_9SAUR
MGGWDPLASFCKTWGGSMAQFQSHPNISPPSRVPLSAGWPRPRPREGPGNPSAAGRAPPLESLPAAALGGAVLREGLKHDPCRSHSISCLTWGVSPTPAVTFYPGPFNSPAHPPTSFQRDVGVPPAARRLACGPRLPAPASHPRASCLPSPHHTKPVLGPSPCRLINKLQPGSVKKVNESTQNWHQLENISNFIKAITKYGVKPHDIFEANDLFESTNYTQVQSTLIALASQAKTKGNKVNMGVKYAEKHQRRFQPEKLKEGRNIIGLQMGTNKFASQQGMTAYGTRRHLYDPKLGTDQPLDQATISLQMGTNKGASQAGMTAPGTKRQIFEPTLGMEHCDSLNVSLQMGSNKGASQQGMTVYGLPRQVYDPKYCLQPNYATVGEDEYNHSQHNFYNSE